MIKYFTIINSKIKLMNIIRFVNKITKKAHRINIRIRPLYLSKSLTPFATGIDYHFVHGKYPKQETSVTIQLNEVNKSIKEVLNKIKKINKTKNNFCKLDVQCDIEEYKAIIEEILVPIKI